MGKKALAPKKERKFALSLSSNGGGLNAYPITWGKKATYYPFSQENSWMIVCKGIRQKKMNFNIPGLPGMWSKSGQSGLLSSSSVWGGVIGKIHRMRKSSIRLFPRKNLWVPLYMQKSKGSRRGNLPKRDGKEYTLLKRMSGEPCQEILNWKNLKKVPGQIMPLKARVNPRPWVRQGSIGEPR